jgi:hypothetical protein
MTKAGDLADSHGIHVPFKRPRNQLVTRAAEQFSELRKVLLGAVSTDPHISART